ncbi:MAG: alpha/beta hydrolase [Armatimonadota bacterium]
MKVATDLVFASPDGVDLRLDLFLPGTEAPAPVVLCIHGGGWISGDKTDCHIVASELVRRGYAAACPDYRLAPLYAYPAAVEDIRAAVRFLRERGAEVGIDPGRVAAFGNSAGGHLSASLALSPDRAERADASVNVAGLTDLTNPSEQHAEIAWDFLQQFLGVPYVGNEERWIEASPLHNIHTDAAPVANIHGTLDEVVNPSQSVRFHEALRKAGATSELLLLPGEGHSFTASGFEEVLNFADNFLKNVLKP